jgi:trimethylamine--corrinoid protein Co-methyltransferase
MQKEDFPMMRSVKVSMFEDGDLKKIHDYSMQILQRNGIHFPNEVALNIFKSHGFKVENEQVYFTEKQVMDALKTCPRQFKLHGRDPKKSLDIGSGVLGVSGPIGPVNVTDIDNGKRPGTLQDVENLIKIYHASDMINVNSNNGVEANDIDISVRYLHIMRAVLRHTDKPFYTVLFGYKALHQAIDMLEIVVGEKLEKGGKTYMSVGSAPSLSPMSWAPQTLEGIIALAERNQAISFGNATCTGVTGPIRPFGTLVMQNAEQLSGIVLSQLVNPGTPVVYGSAAVPGNLANAGYNCGSPTRMILQIGTVEMAKRFYQLPARVLPYSSDSTSVDVQAGIETYESFVGCTLANMDYMLSEIGTLKGLLTTSYEKTIIDEEITSRVLHLRKGIDVSDEAVSLDIILEVGSDNVFLTTEDTLDHMHDEWYPKYTDWNAAEDKRPGDDYEYVLRKANAEWKKRLQEAPETLLDPVIERELDDYIVRVSPVV